MSSAAAAASTTASIPSGVVTSAATVRSLPVGSSPVAIGAARHVRRFGVTPKVALCSHSQFGNLDTESGRKIRSTVLSP